MPRTSLGQKLLLCSVLVGLSGLAVTPPAQATTVGRLSTVQMTDAAEYIVHGTVSDVWTELDDGGMVWTKVQIEVQDAYKGDVGDTLVLSEAGGTYGSRNTMVEGVARFSAGEEILVFASERGQGRIQPIAMSMGKYTVRLDPYTQQRIVQRYAPDLNQRYDARFLPLPAEDQRVGFDDLVGSIQAHLDLGWDGKAIPGIPTERLYRTNKLQPGVK